MSRYKMKVRSPMVEAALGFALGAVGGCVLGSTEDPVDKVMALITSGRLLIPVMDEVRTVGPLGLGTLLGATALTTAMTSVVAGVLLAAAMATVFLASTSGVATHADTVRVWLAAGLAGAVGTTVSGAALGIIVERIVNASGMVGLLWALSIFTVLKPALHYGLKLMWRRGEACDSSMAVPLDRETEQIAREATERERRERVAVEMEQRILSTERESARADGLGKRTAWETQSREKDKEKEQGEAERREKEELEYEQMTPREKLHGVVVRYMDFLAYSGLPMSMTAMITAGFGVFGYGTHQFVFVLLLAVVIVMFFLMMKSTHFYFWMLAGCMGMLATFVIAVLTLHAGQEVLSNSLKMQAAGQNVSRENISTRMNHRSSLEALNAGFFVARLCQLGLGATVGGPLARGGAGEAKVIVGGAGMAVVLLVLLETFAPLLGAGGTAGALLGVVGAAGVSVGAAAVVAVGWSTSAGTIGTLTGMVLGALAMGKWHLVNIGLQVPVAYVFAMTNPFF